LDALVFLRILMMLSGSTSAKINKAGAKSVVQVSFRFRVCILYTDVECLKSMPLTSKGMNITLNTIKSGMGDNALGVNTRRSVFCRNAVVVLLHVDFYLRGQRRSHLFLFFTRDSIISVMGSLVEQHPKILCAKNCAS